MKKSLLLLLCLGLTGCATTAKYEAKLNGWVGASEEALVANWGVPEKTYALGNGKKALEFARKDVVETGGYTHMVPQVVYETGTVGNKPFSSTATTYSAQTEPIHRYRIYCKTSFIIDSNGKVESWHHEGNDCVSQ